MPKTFMVSDISNTMLSSLSIIYVFVGLDVQMPTSSEHSLGAASFKHESWEFDSGARDLSPEPNTLFKLIEASGLPITSNPGQVLDVANKVSGDVTFCFLTTPAVVASVRFGIAVQ